MTPYGPGHLHTGLDIFGAGRENTVPVYAMADGLLTWLPGWKSAVAIQHADSKAVRCPFAVLRVLRECVPY